MKKYIIMLIVLLSIMGCAGDRLKCYQNIQSKYPNSKIINIINTKFQFIVKTESNEIRYVANLSTFDDEITEDILLFKGDKK